MFRKQFRDLIREYRKKNFLYPDHGRSIRPWEQPLRERIQEVLDKARAVGEPWAIDEPNWIE